MSLEVQDRRRPNLWTRRLVCLLWLSVVIAVAVWARVGDYGWDVAIYRSALHSVRAGLDPYAAATAVQLETHRTGGVAAGLDPPYSYVYPPGTLPLMRLIDNLHSGHAQAAYWLLYAMAVLTQIWFAMQFAGQGERRWFLFLAPLAPFFPGLLANGILMSGNIAYILYATVLMAAMWGWRRNRWMPFFLAVLSASFFKAPLLSLAVIAPLSARHKWASTIATCTAGIAIFASQALIWPTLFRHYLEAVNLQFKLNGDFGCSPAGLLSNLFFHLHLPFSLAGFVCYLSYAIPVFLILLHLSRAYFAGKFSMQQWIPVLIVGVLLLNPRLIEYDVAPITLLLALIAWRSLNGAGIGSWLKRSFLMLLLLMNALGLYSWTARKALDGALLVALFSAGCWRLASFAKPQTGLAMEEADYSVTEEHSIAGL